MPPNLHLEPRWFPHDALRRAWRPGYEGGGLQPWLQALLYHMIRATDIRHVVELGTWYGYTSGWLAQAVEDNGGGTATFVEHAPDCAAKTRAALDALGLEKTACEIIHKPSLEYLPRLPDATQFVFLDDDKAAVPEKLRLIKERAPRALVAIHDAETLPFLEERKALLLRIPAADGGGDIAFLWP